MRRRVWSPWWWTRCQQRARCGTGCGQDAHGNAEIVILGDLLAADEVRKGVCTGFGQGCGKGVKESVGFTCPTPPPHLPCSCTSPTKPPTLSCPLSSPLSVPAIHCPLTPHLPHTSPTPAQFLHPTDKINGLSSPSGACAHKSCSSPPTYSTLSPHLLHNYPVPAPHRQDQQPCGVRDTGRLPSQNGENHASWLI